MSVLVKVRETGGSCGFFFSGMSFSFYHLFVEIVKILLICISFVESLVVGQWLGVVVGINVLESCLFYVWVRDEFVQTNKQNWLSLFEHEIIGDCKTVAHVMCLS